MGIRESHVNFFFLCIFNMLYAFRMPKSVFLSYLRKLEGAENLPSIDGRLSDFLRDKNFMTPPTGETRPPLRMYGWWRLWTGRYLEDVRCFPAARIKLTYITSER